MKNPAGWLLLFFPWVAMAAPKPAAPPAAPAPGAANSPKFRTEIGLADIPDPGQEVKSQEAQRLSKLAVAEFSGGDLKEARADFEKALRLAPDNPSLLVNLSLLDYREHNYPSAELRLKRIVRRRPETALAWLILGVVYYDQERLDEALAALAQAVVLAPKDARAHHYLAVTIGKKGWYLGAEDEMRKALELQPDNPESHFNLALFYLQRTPPAIELARRHYHQARTLGAPADPQVEKMLEP